MSKLHRAASVRQIDEQCIVLEFTPDRYRIQSVQLIRQDPGRAIHEYEATINDARDRLVIDCGQTPPVCLVGSSKHVIDHHVQEEILQALCRTASSLVTP
jgi:hypothetical protein